MTKPGGSSRRGIFLQTEKNSSYLQIEGVFWDHFGRLRKFSLKNQLISSLRDLIKPESTSWEIPAKSGSCISLTAILSRILTARAP